MYWNIGKGIMTELIGISANHKKKILSYNGTVPEGCRNCPWYKAAVSSSNPASGLAMLSSGCSTCSKKCQLDLSLFTETTEYVNESNRYGGRRRVCRNAALLFALLNRYAFDGTGYASVNVDVLAERLHVTARTIRNNLSALSAAGYISYGNAEGGLVSVIIPDMPKYYLPASKGGRGYFRVDDDFFDALCGMESVISFRIAVRQFMTGDGAPTEDTYRHMRLGLPDYCKRNVIRDRLGDISRMFVIKADGRRIRFSLKQGLVVKVNLENEKKEHERYFDGLIRSLNDFIMSGRKLEEAGTRSDIKSFFMKDDSCIRIPFYVTEDFRNEITSAAAALSCRFSRQSVKEALADAYRTVICNTDREDIHNIGLYIRAVILNRGPDMGSPVYGKQFNITVA